jgi:hypothetical protein
MFDLINSITINYFLTAAIIVCFLFVGKGMYQSLQGRFRKSVHVGGHDHSYIVPELGITMADGGTRLDGRSNDRRAIPDIAEDEQNIFRSEN